MDIWDWYTVAKTVCIPLQILWHLWHGKGLGKAFLGQARNCRLHVRSDSVDITSHLFVSTHSFLLSHYLQMSLLLFVIRHRELNRIFVWILIVQTRRSIGTASLKLQHVSTQWRDICGVWFNSHMLFSHQALSLFWKHSASVYCICLMFHMEWGWSSSILKSFTCVFLTSCHSGCLRQYFKALKALLMWEMLLMMSDYLNVPNSEL